MGYCAPFLSFSNILTFHLFLACNNMLNQECIPVGCLSSAGLAVGGGCLSGRCLPRGCLPGGVCPSACWDSQPPGQTRGVSALVHAGIHTPLWTEFLTHACENITFPQLRLRMVITTRKRSLGQGNVFTGVCLSTGHMTRGSALRGLPTGEKSRRYASY